MRVWHNKRGRPARSEGADGFWVVDSKRRVAELAQHLEETLLVSKNSDPHPLQLDKHIAGRLDKTGPRGETGGESYTAPHLPLMCHAEFETGMKRSLNKRFHVVIWAAVVG